MLVSSDDNLTEVNLEQPEKDAEPIMRVLFKSIADKLVQFSKALFPISSILFVSPILVNALQL
jgi:hypothetical protein